MSARSALPLRRHPAALYGLCLVELFERLAFSAVLPLLTLYLHEHLGRSEAFAIALPSGFLAASYLASVPGGLLADRFLGMAGAVLVGAVLSAAGFLGLFVDRRAAFWPSLCALLLGQGLFKPGISTLVGHLYSASDSRRESGFFLFYIAINVGALVGPLLSEWARARWGWPSIFACAAGAMGPALGLLVFMRAPRSDEKPQDGSALAAAPVLDERARVQALVLICAVAVVFWLAFQQTSTTLALFAARQTVLDLTVLRFQARLHPGHFAALHAGLVIGFTPLLLGVARRLRTRHAEPSTPQKMVWGFVCIAAAFALVAGASLRGGGTGRVSPLWLGGCYVVLSLGELLLSPCGLSLVAELAPPRWSGRLMGLWFASVAVGHGLAVGLGLLWSRGPHHRYFASIAALALLAAAVLRQRLPALEVVIRRRS